MNSSPFDMLHYARNEHILPVTDGVSLHLFPFQVFIDEDGMFGIQLKSQFYIAVELAGVMDYLHSPATKYVAGTDQHRVADVFGHADCLVQGGYPGSRWLRDVQLTEELLEAAPVFSQIDSFGAGAEQGHATV